MATPPRPARKRRKRFVVVAAAVVLGFAGWSGIVREWFDDSVWVEDRAYSILSVTENGRVYDQALVPLPDGTDLILPTSHMTAERSIGWSLAVTVRRDGPPGVVRVLLEKNRNDASLPVFSLRSDYLRDFRTRTGVWKRTAGASLILDVDRAFWYPHGTSGVHAVFIAPPGVSVRQEACDSHVFAGRRFDDAGPILNDATGPTWEQVRQVPLARKEFP